MHLYIYFPIFYRRCPTSEEKCLMYSNMHQIAQHSGDFHQQRNFWYYAYHSVRIGTRRSYEYPILFDDASGVAYCVDIQCNSYSAGLQLFNVQVDSFTLMTMKHSVHNPQESRQELSTRIKDENHGFNFDTELIIVNSTLSTVYKLHVDIGLIYHLHCA